MKPMSELEKGIIFFLIALVLTILADGFRDRDLHYVKTSTGIFVYRIKGAK